MYVDYMQIHFINGTLASVDFGIRRGPGTNPARILRDDCISILLQFHVTSAYYKFPFHTPLSY